MINRMNGVYSASIAAIVAVGALTGCSGADSADDEAVGSDSAAVSTNHGANDRGINSRGATANAGAPFPGLAAGNVTLFDEALDRFGEIDSVSGTEPGADGVGLGPTFNANSCGACHAQPALLGAGVSLGSPQFPNTPNPQVAQATEFGARNTVPSFITAAGPTREARFIKNPDGSADGGVHGLFTIGGRTDAPGCNATQPDFATAVANHNVSFRIPIPTFGEGLIEGVPEASLEANLTTSTSASLGIHGTFNRSGNDGSITRFGWKAQNKSLLIFSGEAYNVEQGVSNLAFPEERAGGAGSLQGCFNFNRLPEDGPNSVDQQGHASAGGDYSQINTDLINFALAMELSAPPDGALSSVVTAGLHVPTGSSSSQIMQGFNQFVNSGCANCHTVSLTTVASSLDAAQSNVTFHAYSDFAIHHMGNGLQDGVTQGGAGPDQFRTAPLWGLGQRQFFLHDGRTNDLVVAISAHSSAAANGFPASEANQSVTNFNNLTQSDQQAVLDFLRAL